MIIFGIETSCDETATALVEVETRKILAHRVYTQLEEHTPYGGVVPEIAARAHLQKLPYVAQQVIEESGIEWCNIDGIAAATGPGLTTALAIGSTFGKTLAWSLSKRFLATNHIEAHALTPHFANPRLGFPYLLLLASGGHCQLVWVEGVGHYAQLGGTVDDAAGECFDKVGKLMGLPHPAGPAVEKLAAQGNPRALTLPHPKTANPLDFSFSGLKTAMRELLTTHPTRHTPEDLAASFQHTVATTLSRKTAQAIRQTGAKQVVVAGGVAANQCLRAALEAACLENGATFSAPPMNLCTDNAVMIAYAAGLRAINGLSTGGLTSPVRPRWPLEEMAT